MPRYELIKGKQKKFWTIARGVDAVVTHEGDLGGEAAGSRQLLDSAKEVAATFKQEIAAKVKAGYKLVDPGPLPAKGKGVRYDLAGTTKYWEIVKVLKEEIHHREGDGATVGKLVEDWYMDSIETQDELANLIAGRVSAGYTLSTTKAAKPAKKLKAPKGITESVTRAKAWMSANGGDAIVKNLAKGATDAAIKKAEKKLGFPIPAALAELWKLHDGQKDEGDCFLHSRNFLSADESVRFRADFVRSIQFIIDDADSDPLKPAERNDRWLPFAMQDSDMTAIHATTGRVFDFCEELTLEDKTLTAFFESFTKSVEHGDYTVEEGFGGVYLSS